MSVTLQRPPSGRNFEVFQAVIVGGMSTREAAGQFRLSQTRVCQIVERVQAWQAEVLPADCPLPEEARLRLSRTIAAERINHLYGEVMGAWRRSQGEFKQTRTARFGDEVTTIKSAYGDPKYLLAASRLAKAAGELGAAGTALLWPEEEGADLHPIEDCSQNGQSRPNPASAAAEPAAVTAETTRTSRELSPLDALARREPFAPVQRDLSAELASSQSGIQLQLTPDQPGATTRPLSRQQRRKLQRALRKAAPRN